MHYEAISESRLQKLLIYILLADTLSYWLWWSKHPWWRDAHTKGLRGQWKPSPTAHRELTRVHAQSCPPLCHPIDCSLPGSSVHGISQARIFDWVAISFSRGSSQPRNWTWVFHGSCIGRWILYHCVIWEAHKEMNAAITLLSWRTIFPHPSFEIKPGQYFAILQGYLEQRNNFNCAQRTAPQ